MGAQVEPPKAALTGGERETVAINVRGCGATLARAFKHLRVCESQIPPLRANGRSMIARGREWQVVR